MIATDATDATGEMAREELLQRGYKALLQELGPANMIRFIQLFRPGSGDYTAERHQWLDGKDIKSIAESIMKKRDEKEG